MAIASIIHSANPIRTPSNEDLAKLSDKTSKSAETDKSKTAGEIADQNDSKQQLQLKLAAEKLGSSHHHHHQSSNNSEASSISVQELMAEQGILDSDLKA